MVSDDYSNNLSKRYSIDTTSSFVKPLPQEKLRDSPTTILYNNVMDMDSMDVKSELIMKKREQKIKEYADIQEKIEGKISQQYSSYSNLVEPPQKADLSKNSFVPQKLHPFASNVDKSLLAVGTPPFMIGETSLSAGNGRAVSAMPDASKAAHSPVTANSPSLASGTPTVSDGPSTPSYILPAHLSGDF
jgi:hypothetical protein